MQLPPATLPGRRRFYLPLLISLVATIGFASIAVLMLADMRSDTSARAQETSENLLQVIGQDLLHNIEVLNLSLDAIVEGMARPDVTGMEPSLRNMLLFDRAITAKHLGSVAVFDTEGRLTLLADNVQLPPIRPVTEREYFQAQLQPGRGLFISAPYRSQIINSEVIGLSRRVYDQEGNFAGVALGTIRLSYFADLFRQLRLGHAGTISVLRQDGAVIARYPDEGSSIGQTLRDAPEFKRMLASPSGTFLGKSSEDGIERMVTFKQIAGQPLIVSVALGTADIFGAWYRKAVLLGIMVLLVTGASVTLTVFLTRELKRRAVAENELRTVNAELARLSRTDPLTGLGNRRCFDETLARETDRARSTDKPLALLVLDVDRFKQFNDRFGHGEGDEALKLVAECLRARMSRAEDQSCRIGGEELAVILPGTDPRGAAMVAEALRLAVRQLRISHPDSPGGVVTVSVGFACLGSREEPAGLFARADAALYRAKEEGRDRVCVAADTFAGQQAA